MLIPLTPGIRPLCPVVSRHVFPPPTRTRPTRHRYARNAPGRRPPNHTTLCSLTSVLCKVRRPSFTARHLRRGQSLEPDALGFQECFDTGHKGFPAVSLAPAQVATGGSLAPFVHSGNRHKRAAIGGNKTISSSGLVFSGWSLPPPPLLLLLFLLSFYWYAWLTYVMTLCSPIHCM